VNSQQILMVQDSFEQVKPIARDAAGLFYARLFELDPALKALFRGDLAQQGQMLMAMIGTAVAGLRDLPRLVPTLHALGARHVAYGVRPMHYETVGAALIWTLENGLGDSFKPAVREAWSAAYQLLANTMQEGAAKGERTRAD
jgi:hemoglobin-like flavoprotein